MPVPGVLTGNLKLIGQLYVFIMMQLNPKPTAELERDTNVSADFSSSFPVGFCVEPPQESYVSLWVVGSGNR